MLFSTFDEALQASLHLQENHGVRALCAFNVGMLYRYFKNDVDYKMGIVMYLDEDGFELFTEHAWIEKDGRIVETSAEFLRGKPPKYMSFKDLRLDQESAGIHRDWKVILGKIREIRDEVERGMEWGEYRSFLCSRSIQATMECRNAQDRLLRAACRLKREARWRWARKWHAPIAGAT